LSWFTTLILAAVVGYEILKRKKSKYIKEYSVIGFWAFFGFLFSQIAASASGKLYYGRIPVFIYPFAIIAVTFSILKFKKYQLKKILICVLIIFMALQLFRVDFVPINPIGAVEPYSIKSNEIYSILNGPQDMQGIKAAIWFGTDKNSKLNFTTQITVNGKKYWVEPYAEYENYYITPTIARNKSGYLKEYANRFYTAQWYTSTNHIINLNLYFNENLVYDNGKSKIWSTRT